MRTVTYRLGDLHRAVIPIGFVGENEHSRILFDCLKVFEEYPSAVAALTVQPPYGEAYPAVVVRDGNIVYWDIYDSDLTQEGRGEAQLTFSQGDVVVKSFIVRTSIERSLVGTGDVPDPLDDFLARAGEALTAIPETIDAALAAAKASGEFDGADGQDGQDGADGFSPTVAVTEITGGHQVAVTDAEGTTTFDVMDGVDGQDGSDGAPGADGFSPRATVSKSGKVATITITDAAGTTTAQISDGEDGQGTNIIDDEAGAGDTDKTFSADKLTADHSSLLNEITEMQGLFVEESVGESVTLTNQDSWTNIDAQNGTHRYGSQTLYPRELTTYGGTQTNPVIGHMDMNLGNHKWMIGFKYRMSKMVSGVSSPQEFRVYPNYQKHYDKTPVLDEWQTFCEVDTTDLNMVYIQMRGFSPAPGTDEFKIEIKDYFIYNVDDVSAEMLTIIENSQDINFQDGTVTYTSGGGSGGLVPDSSLTMQGKAADSKAVGDALGIPTITNIPFSFDDTYLNSSGEEASASGYTTTDYFDVTDADAIAFTGKMGSSNTVFWYDSTKTFISAALKPQEKMIWYYNILTIKPATAKYVRLVSKKTSASNPPPVAPEATAYYGKGYINYLLKNIAGDGTTDDTTAVQKVVNMANSVVFPKVEKIRLTSSISIALGYTKLIDGNGVTLIADGDFYALTVEGTLNTSAAPSTIEEYVLKSEGGTLIENFKITSSDGTSGGGIQAGKAFNLKLENNYIYRCKNGIRLYGMCRDMIVSQNHIFAITQSGILFDQNINLHQCNVNNNIVMFALTCVNINDPAAIANFQITGNDIEIVNYPSTGYENCKCIKFASTQKPGMFAEIEICGNTIQGHETSGDLMYFSGHADEPISDMSITGNHISNSQDRAIYLENCCNVSITGNNYNQIKHYVYDLYGNCENVLIVGDTARNINANTVAAGGKVHADSNAVLNNVKCKNVICTPTGTNDIETSSTTNVDLD